MGKIHTILLGDAEAKALAYFLNELRRDLSNSCCNDLPNDLVNLFTPEEGEKLATEFARYNNPDEPEGPSWPIPDFCLVSLIRHKIVDQCNP